MSSSNPIIVDLHRDSPSLDPDHYSDVATLFSDHSIVVRKSEFHKWRLVKPSHAMIRGQQYWGNCTALATDGVQVLIASPARPYPILVLRSNYMAELEGRGKVSAPKHHHFDDEDEESKLTKKPKQPKKPALMARLESLMADLDI